MKQIIMVTGLAIIMVSCNNPGKNTDTALEGNPFFTEYTTPFGVPPFEDIELEHYMPAFLKAMEEEVNEVKAITENSKKPTFENTVVALDQCGVLLRKVNIVFSGQNGANTNDRMQEISRELSPLLSKHRDDINLNPVLFARIKAVYEKKSELGLNKEEAKLLEETYKGFVRGGANLSAEGQEKLRGLNSRIAILQLTFGQNMLKETNDFKLFVDRKEDLSGLPDNLIATAATAATEAGQDGKWLFTQHNPSVMPFLQYADNRELREKMFKGYINRGNQDNAADNRKIVQELVALRLEKAKLMGYNDYASFVLEERMAKNAGNVYGLLDEVWVPAMEATKNELADINTEIKKSVKNFTAEGWDWRYYFEKAKTAKYNLDENEVRPYLKLENVLDGAFYVADRLYGISFTPIDKIPLPHPDAMAFECKDEDGTHLGVIYFDFFPRAGKRGGAWCGGYRAQTYAGGKRVAPIVTIVCNFSQPAAGQPALLSADEANTLFHEFGHGLHSLFRDVHYYGISGVPRDFVELPSQIMEHWVFEPDVLKVYAKHYQTNETIPVALIEKLDKSGKYGQGFITVEYVAASYLDMDFHVFKSIPEGFNVMDFEAKTLEARGLLKQIPPRYRSTYFNHTMGGGYTAGYYSYLWSEVLDCDAFDAFTETGDIFNRDVAKKFREYVLTPGSIDDAMDMYINFRGKKPGTEPLLRNRGLK